MLYTCYNYCGIMMDVFLMMADAEFALRLDPENKELKQQYTTSKELCKKVLLVPQLCTSTYCMWYLLPHSE